MGERENGNGRGGKMFNRHSSKEGLKIGERGHEDVSGELGVRPGQFNSKYAMEKFSSLLKKMESYRQRLAEVEEEVRSHLTYSETPNKGPLELGTTSLQRTHVAAPC